MGKDETSITLTLASETAVWLRELLDGLQLKEAIPLEHARKLLAYKDEVAGQLPAKEASREAK
jgi:hypothetical protein